MVELGVAVTTVMEAVKEEILGTFQVESVAVERVVVEWVAVE